MRYRTARLLLLLLLMCVEVSSGQEPSADAATGIEGIVTVSPTRPGPSRRGSETRNVAPLPNAIFRVANDKGNVASFTSGPDGRFHVVLKPGHYIVSLAEQPFPRPCGPFEVDVASGKMSQAEWHCDTGMR
jgi:hypothetical protein